MRGGRPFRDPVSVGLPPGSYTEWDVHPPGTLGRDGERLLVNDLTGETYFTRDHYRTFIPIDIAR
ncbi:MAG: hypothetical protein IT306_27270 [Chloroflexi bacterium]|nr:hypothetical protein [Chloroflexota bacterium]